MMNIHNATEQAYKNGYAKGFADATDIKVGSKAEWISVEERLPDGEGYFMVWNKEQKRIEIRFFYRLPPRYPVETYPEVREYFGNCADYKKITHWMPLPEPPKGE